MPPKPSFRVKLPPKQHKIYPLQCLHPPTIISFALPGTLAERKLQRKSQRESNFNSYHVQKSRLAEWGLNASASPSQSVTRMSASQIPVETKEYLEKVDCAQSTAQQYTLGSPISLSRMPLKAPTLDESEAAEILLSLFSVRLESPAMQIEDYINMDIDSEIQAPTLSVTTAHDTPLLPLIIPGDFSSSSGLLIEDYNMDIDTEIQAPTTASGFGVSTAADTLLHHPWTRRKPF